MPANRRIYMDNAATSRPKPPEVWQAMQHFATDIGASAGRGGYAEAQEAGRLLVECRNRVNTFIGGENPAHVIFTLNCSDALNLAIRGIVLGPWARSKKDRHVITTDMSHNSVLRPFAALGQLFGITQTRLPADPQTGLIDPDDVRRAIRPDTCLIAIVHGSNVGGGVQPIRPIGEIARAHDIPYLVDAAQTMGHVPIDAQADLIDLLAFPGHKGLLGPSGTGAFYIRPGVEKRMTTVREGGTGSASEVDVQPDFMPDRFEAGSHNALGLVGLSAGIKWLTDQGRQHIWAHEQELIATMLRSLADAGLGDESSGLTLYGPRVATQRCGVFSLRIAQPEFAQPHALSKLLEDQFGILTRSGIHCAPGAHHTFGTRDLGGATRLSFGPFITVEDVRYTCDALTQICQQSLALRR